MRRLAQRDYKPVVGKKQAARRTRAKLYSAVPLPIVELEAVRESSICAGEYPSMRYTVPGTAAGLLISAQCEEEHGDCGYRPQPASGTFWEVRWNTEDETNVNGPQKAQ